MMSSSSADETASQTAAEAAAAVGYEGSTSGSEASSVDNSETGEAPDAPSSRPSKRARDSSSDSDSDSSLRDDSSSTSAAAAAAAAASTSDDTSSQQQKKKTKQQPAKRARLSDRQQTIRSARSVAKKQIVSACENMSRRDAWAAFAYFAAPISKDGGVGMPTRRMAVAQVHHPKGKTGVPINTTLGSVLNALSPECELPEHLDAIEMGPLFMTAVHMQVGTQTRSNIPAARFYEALKPKYPIDSMRPGGAQRARNATQIDPTYLDPTGLKDPEGEWDDQNPRWLETKVLMAGTRRLLTHARADTSLWFGGCPDPGSVSQHGDKWKFVVRRGTNVVVDETVDTQAEVRSIQRGYAAKTGRLLNCWRIWPDDPEGNTIQMFIKCAPGASTMQFFKAEENLPDRVKITGSCQTILVDSIHLDMVAEFVWSGYPSPQHHNSPLTACGDIPVVRRTPTPSTQKVTGILSHLAGDKRTRPLNNFSTTDNSGHECRDLRMSNWTKSKGSSSAAAAAAAAVATAAAASDGAGAGASASDE